MNKSGSKLHVLNRDSTEMGEVFLLMCVVRRSMEVMHFTSLSIFLLLVSSSCGGCPLKIWRLRCVTQFPVDCLRLLVVASIANVAIGQFSNPNAHPITLPDSTPCFFYCYCCVPSTSSKTFNAAASLPCHTSIHRCQHRRIICMICSADKYYFNKLKNLTFS